MQPSTSTTDPAYWEALLTSEGMPAEPRPLAGWRPRKEAQALVYATESLPHLPVSRAKREAARARLEPYLSVLPPDWRATFRLRWQGLTQVQIARRQGVAQPTVSTRLKVGTARMRDRARGKIPHLTPEQVVEHVRTVVPKYNPCWLETIETYLACRSQSVTATQLGICQSAVSYRVRRTIAYLRHYSPGATATRVLKSTLRQTATLPEPRPVPVHMPPPHRPRDPSLPQAGAAGSAGKLTPSQVREIRARAAQGEALRSIAADFPVTYAGVARVRRRATYAWVTDG